MILMKKVYDNIKCLCEAKATCSAERPRLSCRIRIWKSYGYIARIDFIAEADATV